MLTYRRVLLGVFLAAFASEAIVAIRWALQTTISLGSDQAAEALALRGIATAINAALIYAVLRMIVGAYKRWRARPSPDRSTRSESGSPEAEPTLTYDSPAHNGSEPASEQMGGERDERRE